MRSCFECFKVYLSVQKIGFCGHDQYYDYFVSSVVFCVTDPQRSPRRPFKPTVTAALDIATDDDDDDDSDLDDLDLSEEFDFDSFPSDINGLVGELSKDKKRKRKGSKSKAFLEFDSDSDIDKDLDIDADLEDDFDKILGVDKVDSVWCKTSTGRSPRRKTPKSPPLDVPLVSSSGVADTDPQTEGVFCWYGQDRDDNTFSHEEINNRTVNPEIVNCRRMMIMLSILRQ